MKVGQLSKEGKFHIVQSNSITNNSYESKCGQVFSKEEVKDIDGNELGGLLKNGTLCGHCTRKHYK